MNWLEVIGMVAVGIILGVIMVSSAVVEGNDRDVDRGWTVMGGDVYTLSPASPQ